MTTRRQARAFLRAFTAAAAAALLIFAVGSAGAADATGNLLQNPSLEQGSGTTPTCWLLGGYGSNAYRWTWTSDAHSGSRAQRLDLFSRANGDRKLLTAFNGSCSPAVTTGHSYRVSVWYKSSAQPAIFAFSRTSSSGYRWWAQSPRLPSSSVWREASWTTPVVPAGVTNLSVGLGLQVAGSLTMDDFSLVDTTASTGGSDTTPPSATISCNGTTCSSGYYSQSVNVSLAATDNSGGSGLASIRYTTDGTSPSLANGSSYSAPLVIGASMTISYRAYDNAGNAGAVNSQKIAIDQAPPTVSLSAPQTGTVLSGTATLAASATDNVAVDRVGFLVDGTSVGSDASAPYSLAWNSASVADGTHTVSARALDTAGNAVSSAATVTVKNAATPPPPPPAPAPAPAPNPLRQVFCVGSSFSGDTTDTGWGRQYGQIPTPKPSMVVFDNSVGVMQSVGCNTLRMEILPGDPTDANGCCQRAQVIHSSAGLGMTRGEEHWYGLAYRTNPGYRPQNSSTWPNWNAIHTLGHVTGGGPLCTELSVEVATRQNTGPGGYVAFTDGLGPRLELNYDSNVGGVCHHFHRYVPHSFIPGHRYVEQLHVRWGDYPNGCIEWWVDGEQIVPWTCGYGSMAPGYGMYPVLENYRPANARINNLITWTNDVYYGGLILGSTRESVVVP
jgi:hypothetical protein